MNIWTRIVHAIDGHATKRGTWPAFVESLDGNLLALLPCRRCGEEYALNLGKGTHSRDLKRKIVRKSLRDQEV